MPLLTSTLVSTFRETYVCDTMRGFNVAAIEDAFYNYCKNHTILYDIRRGLSIEDKELHFQSTAIIKATIKAPMEVDELERIQAGYRYPADHSFWLSKPASE